MSEVIYMKLDGVTGDVTTKGYEDWIAINSISHNNARVVSTRVGKLADREGTTPNFHEFLIHKMYDGASHPIFAESCSPRAINKAEIHVCKNGDQPQPIRKIVLSDVIISNQGISSVTGSSSTQYFTMSTSKIQLTHIGYDKYNKPESPVVLGYDLEIARSI